MQRSLTIALTIVTVSVLGGSHNVVHAIQPFWTSNNFTISDGADNNVVSFDVPNGFTWVVESMGGRIQLPTGQHIVSALLFTNVTPSIPNPAVLHFNPTLISQGAPFYGDIYGFNTLTRAYLTNTVTLSVTRAEFTGEAQINVALHGYLIPAVNGDYNANGAVDAADYVTYRNTVGQMGVGLFADGNGDNQVEPGDLGVWNSQFGNPPTTVIVSALSSAVPEPASVVLLMAVAGALLLRR